MEQLNSNIERVIEANSTIEVFNTGAFYALVRAYKYVVVDNKPVKEKINVPFSFDLYNKDNDKISTGTISPGEKATFKVPTYKMVINNTYDYEVHIVFSFGSGTVDQLKTDLELTVEDLDALTKYDKLDYELLRSTNVLTFTNLETLASINAILTAQTAIDKTPIMLAKYPIYINFPPGPYIYFNAFDLRIENSLGTLQNYFITHIDISFDYSQCHGSTTNLVITNTFNPGMSFGKYGYLKNLTPQDAEGWNEHKWTNRADTELPTRSKSLVIENGFVKDDGSFRVEINKPYGVLVFDDIDNFILKTDIVSQARIGAPAHPVAIRAYKDTPLIAPATITEKVLTGNYNFGDYNKCSTQKPIRTKRTNMFVVDVSIYGYLMPAS